MKRETVYMIHVNPATHMCSAQPERGYVDRYVHGDFNLVVCYAPYGTMWKSAVGGVMCVSGVSLGACKDRTTAAIADMIALGELPRLLSVQMTLNDVLQEHGGQVTRQKYNALYKKYLVIAEGMLDV